MHYINLYTIGFTKKLAEVFFGIIRDAGVQKVIDIRLNNTRQFAGFTKKNDLAYFLNTICGCDYRHEPLLAPTKQIFNAYKKGQIDWAEYEKQFKELLRERKPLGLVSPSELNMACLLCCEVTAENCHRRLVAEYFRDHFTGLEITHL